MPKSIWKSGGLHHFKLLPTFTGTQSHFYRVFKSIIKEFRSITRLKNGALSHVNRLKTGFHRHSIMDSMVMGLNISDILKTLPHRYPFVLIDRILNLIPGERIVALKNVTTDESLSLGYSPGRLMMPGLLIVEAMAQAGGVLALTSLTESEARSATPYFMRMDNVKFIKPGLPGRRIVIEVGYLKKSSWAVQFSGIATIGGEKAVEAKLTATLGR